MAVPSVRSQEYFYPTKEEQSGAREIAQQLRVLPALTEDLSLVFSTYEEQFKITYNSSSRGSNECPFLLASEGTHVYMVCIHIHIR